jgi:hypothetical protein
MFWWVFAWAVMTGSDIFGSRGGMLLWLGFAGYSAGLHRRAPGRKREG